MSGGVVILLAFMALLGFGGFALLFKGYFSQTPELDLDKAIKEAGYEYDPKQHIFFSRMDAWQRDYGYCSLYDKASAPLGLVFDCEPVRFEYGGRRWLIEFWKGQYGMTTGCEIGVYYADKTASESPEDMFYKCADDKNLLPMALALRKNNRVLFKRSARHWWLTGFILGEFSEPQELSMDIAVTLKDREMLSAFEAGLAGLGYKETDFKIIGNSVFFTLSTPRSPQPRLYAKLTSRLSQWRNSLLCKVYRKLTNNSADIYEAAEMIRQRSSWLYKSIFDMGKPLKLLKKREVK